MSDSSTQSRREAVQPSLWDRLLDDLPGLGADITRARAALASALGEDRLAGILAGGRRALEEDKDLTTDQRKAVHVLLTQTERLGFLQSRGVVVTADVLREAVRRDIEALFNTERMQARVTLSNGERGSFEDPEDVIADFPHVRRSVLNYGVPAYSGRRSRDFDAEALARELREVVATFEPRLKRDTIRIRVETDDRMGVKIRIDGTLLLSPVPERMRLSTTIDLDNGRAATFLEDV